MTARLAAHVWVNALIRRVNAAGGFATVIAKGDREAGGVLLLLVSHDCPTQVMQRVTGRDGGFVWQQTAVIARDDPSGLQDYLDRQRRYDSDLWIVELDIPDAERFIAEPAIGG